MEVSAQLLFSSVMHKRLFPKENAFSYRVYNIAVDIEHLDELADGRWFGVNRWGLASFYEKDHGPCDGSSLNVWAADLIARHGGDLAVSKIVLVAMPRILGYGFNPVSFWLCQDEHGELRAVIAEVHNTFGERHVYFCRNANGGVISRGSEIHAEKCFHVSPFMERNGHYTFRFDLRKKGFGVWIDYHHQDGRKQLLTSMSGDLRANTRSSRLKAFITCPLVTIKTVMMIHWQAVKLLFKGIRYVPKPTQLDDRVVLSKKITEN